MLAVPFKIPELTLPGTKKVTSFRKTIATIQKAVSPRKVSTYSTDWRGLDHAILHKEADLAIAGAAAYRRNIHSGLRDLLTSTAPPSPDPDHVMGSVIYFLAQDDRIFSLKDLKRKIQGTNQQGAYWGELTVLKELHDQGYDPYNFFSKRLYLGDDVKARLKALEEGQVDAIVLNAYFAEN